MEFFVGAAKWLHSSAPSIIFFNLKHQINICKASKHSEKYIYIYSFGCRVPYNEDGVNTYL